MKASMVLLTRRVASAWTVCTFVLSAAGATELRLAVVDSSSAPVQLLRAQVIVTTWGQTERVDLPVEGNHVVVPLDAAWPLPRLRHVEYANLFLNPVDHVPMMSEQFGWIGQTRLVNGKSVKVTAAEIRFQDGTAVGVADGETKEMDLVARRPHARLIKLVSPEGEPVPGVMVSRYLFWSSRCHTGAMMGSEPLGDAVTDKKGRIRVADADVEYAFQIRTPHCIFLEPAPRGYDYRNEVTTRLTGKNTILVVRELKPRPLEMVVSGPDGRPVAGATLFGSLFGHEAIRNPWSGPVASADSSGRVYVRDFYPDECGRLFFSDADNQTIWKMDPADLPAQGPLRVELSIAPLTG